MHPQTPTPVSPKKTHPLTVFIGPCVMESESFVHDVAYTLQEALAPLQDQGLINWFFKASFDKANRSSRRSFRGPGIDQGLKIFQDLKKSLNIKTLTDIHLPEQADAVAETVDILQIPAFLCRQTDLLLSAAEACHRYKRTMNIKKGQFLSPYAMKHIWDKITPELPSNTPLYFTERGSCFGHENLVVDMKSFSIMKDTGAITIHDATHSMQKPAGQQSVTGGDRRFIPAVGRAAIAAGAQGIFIEVHPEPLKALSDSTTSFPLQLASSFISELSDLYQKQQEWPDYELPL